MNKAFAIIMISLLIVTFSLGGESADNFSVFVDGEDSGFVGRIIGDSFFVPARILEQHFGAQMQWFGVLKLLEVNLGESQYRLRQGDKNMQVDKVVKVIPPPELIDGALWIPVRDVLTPLGYILSFDSDTKILHINGEINTIKEIAFDREKQKLIVKADNPFIYMIEEKNPCTINLLNVQGDERLIKKLEDVKNEIDERPPAAIRIVLPEMPLPLVTEEFKEDGFKLVFQFPSRLIEAFYNEGIGRLELTTLGPLQDYNIFQLKEPGRLVIDLEGLLLDNANLVGEGLRASQFTLDPMVARIVIPAVEDVNYVVRQPEEKKLILEIGSLTIIDKISWINDESGKGLLINSSRPIELKSFTLIDPLRLVFDIPDAFLQAEAVPIEISEGAIQRIRHSQFDADTVRIVFDLQENFQTKINSWEEKGYKTKIGFQHKLMQVKHEEGVFKDRYHMDVSGIVDYEIHYLPSPERLVIDLNDTVTDIDSSFLPQEGGVVRGLRVSQYSHNPDIVRVVLDLAFNPQYQVLPSTDNRRISLEFTKSPLLGQTIVIDPGHGGFDPGAIGITGVYEKDVVLDIGIRLKELIQKTGARVIMTRDKDEFASLWARAELANKVEADAFISIHANSVSREGYDGLELKTVDPKGTETYIIPGCSNLTHKLAETVHHEVYTTLNLQDRGIKYKSYDVLVPLQMPGILLEVAFLSNPMEEMLLKDANRRQLVAEAILKGLNNYFTQLRLGER